jgi:hypothetical protein
VPGRRRQDQGSVGQLLFGPAVKGLDQMMAPKTKRVLERVAAESRAGTGPWHWDTGSQQNDALTAGTTC